MHPDVPRRYRKLFELVPIGTQVNIVNQPIKLGWQLDSLFIELHPPLEEDEAKYANYKQITIAEINSFLMQKRSQQKLGVDFEIDHEALERAIAEKSGIPVMISRTPS